MSDSATTMPELMHTVASLTVQLRAAGLAEGMTLIVHSSLKQVGGWICGGPPAVIHALLAVLGPRGTLVMPTHTSDNSEPAYWQHPPIPKAWWPRVRAETPAYDPATSITRQMGILTETLRNWPGARRSSHPQTSFCAIGHHAERITAQHSLEEDLGEGSPLSAIYDLDGHIFLLGVDHSNNTSLHLAEYRADYTGRHHEMQGAAMLVDGQRQWVTYRTLAVDSDDFAALGRDYEASHPVQRGRVGLAETRLVRQRDMVDYAVGWLASHRGAGST